MNRHKLSVTCVLFLLVPCVFAGGNNYKNFDVASHARVIDVQEMKDPAWLERSGAAVTKYVKFDKIYLATHKEIGHVSGISDNTTRNHANDIIGKLEVCDRTEAATIAMRQGLTSFAD